MAHLEGAYEQIDKRLGGVESGLSQLRQEMQHQYSGMQQQISGLRQQTQEQFPWILGFQIVSWFSMMRALIAFLFRR